jgi:prophage regulatory protein
MSTGRTDGAFQPLASTATDAARLCGVSRSQWFKLQAMGKVPAPVRLGTRAPRWRVDELKAWLAAGCPDRAVWERQRAEAAE